MSTTVKELSQKLNLKRNSIEMRMSQIPDFRKKYVTRKGNRLIISDKGGELICNLYGGRKRHVNSSVKHAVNNKVNDYQIDSLRKILKDRSSHIHDLQKQLDHVYSSNAHLGKLLDQQQQLQLTSQGEVHRLQGQIRHLKAVSGPVNKSTNQGKKQRENPDNGANKRKSSFWRRFFSKL